MCILIQYECYALIDCMCEQWIPASFPSFFSPDFKVGQGMGLLNQLTHAWPTGPSRTYYDAIQ